MKDFRKNLTYRQVMFGLMLPLLGVAFSILWCMEVILAEEIDIRLK